MALLATMSWMSSINFWHISIRKPASFSTKGRALSIYIHAVVSEVTIPLFSARSRECACMFSYVYLYCVYMCSVPLIGVIR